MSSDDKGKKPGPDPEVLKVGGDPAEALDRLLGKESSLVPNMRVECRNTGDGPDLGEYDCEVTLGDEDSFIIPVRVSGRAGHRYGEPSAELAEHIILEARTFLRASQGRDFKKGDRVFKTGDDLTVGRDAF